MRPSVFLLALGYVAACATPSEHHWSSLHETPLRLAKHLVVPLLEEQSKRPVVRLTLNGRETSFLVDSGSGHSYVEPGVARELGLELKAFKSFTATGATGHSIAIDHFVAVERMELSALVIEDIVLFVLDADVLRAGHFGGILGGDVLARLTIVFDMERHALHILSPGTDRAGIQAYLAESPLGPGGWELGEIRYDGDVPYVPLAHAGPPELPVEILVDTGSSSGTSLPEPLIASLGLLPIEANLDEVAGVGGEYRARYYDWKFGLCKFEITGTIKSCPIDPGILGMDILGHFAFVLDGPGKSLWLQLREVSPYR